MGRTFGLEASRLSSVCSGMISACTAQLSSFSGGSWCPAGAGSLGACKQLQPEPKG